MAKRTKSGLKRKRQDLKRGVRNQAIRSRVKTLLKDARAAEQPGGDALRAAISALDAAARKGIVHPNAAARKKSRLMRWAGSQAQASA
ncbi:MAG TPA: 30S ribosomal protein S20 [bacterium]|nr:30S ribosomal protein S20 [bacterium]